MCCKSHVILSLLVAVLLLSPAPADDKPVQSIKGYGTFVDPDGDCQVKEKNGGATIVVPKTYHDLTGTGGDSKLNAPRILQDAKGDFTFQGKFEGFELPFKKPVSGGINNFVCSGLLIWQDDQNFIRLDRGAVANHTHVWFHGFRDGNAMSHKLESTSNYDTYFRVMRKGNKFTFDTSTNGEDWTKFQSVEVKFAEDIRVGVLAVNSTTEEFSVTIRDLILSPGSK